MKGKYDVKYDAVKQQKKFVSTWRNHYPWLQICVEEKYNDGSIRPDFMQCRVCVNNPLIADKRSAFFIGSTNSRIDPIKKHNLSR